ELQVRSALVNQFDRDRPLQTLVHGAVHRAHATFSELLFNSIVAQDLPDHTGLPHPHYRFNSSFSAHRTAIDLLAEGAGYRRAVTRCAASTPNSRRRWSATRSMCRSGCGRIWNGSAWSTSG